LLDIGVAERRAGILTGVVVDDETVGLMTLDVVVDLAKGNLIVGDPAPTGVPAVEDDGGDLAIIG